MNSEQVLLTNFENWTLRVRPGTGSRLLLLLHGWTGSEDSMTIFMNHFPLNYWIVSPRAPFPADSGGFSWRSPAPRGSWPSMELFRPSAELLMGMVHHWSLENEVDAISFDVAGFSQGGAMTFTLGTLYPEKIGKMGILSGFAPVGIDKLLSKEFFAGKKVFVSHGTQDDMVPISMAAQTVQLLEQAGAQVSYCQSDIGHKLSSDCLKAFVKFLVD